MPGRQNSPESLMNSKPGDQNPQDIDEIEAWGPELEFQKSFKKAVGSLGTGFGHFPIGNRSPYGHFRVACQNLKNPRHRGIGRLDARIGGLGSQNPRELSMNLEAGGQIPRELSKNWKPGSQNQPESSRITDVSSRIIDEFT